MELNLLRQRLQQQETQVEELKKENEKLGLGSSDAEREKLLTANKILVREKEEVMLRLEKQMKLVEMLMNEKATQSAAQNIVTGKTEALEILQKVSSLSFVTNSGYRRRDSSRKCCLIRRWL